MICRIRVTGKFAKALEVVQGSVVGIAQICGKSSAFNFNTGRLGRKQVNVLCAGQMRTFYEQIVGRQRHTVSQPVFKTETALLDVSATEISVEEIKTGLGRCAPAQRSR